MTAHDEKVRLTVECSFDERTYIKMLAVKKHMTISEFLLSPVRQTMPHARRKRRSKSHTRPARKPNAETVEALKESREGKLESYKTLDDFWEAMGIDPNA